MGQVMVVSPQFHSATTFKAVDGKNGATQLVKGISTGQNPPSFIKWAFDSAAAIAEAVAGEAAKA